MVGDNLIFMNKKSIIIYSTIKLYNGNSAGSARVFNYARALARSCQVYLISFKERRKINIQNIQEVEPNIFIVGLKKEDKNKITKKILKPFLLLKFILNMLTFAKKDDVVFFLYPSTEVLLDYLSIMILKFIKRKKIFIEINEVRRYSSFLLQNVSFFNSPYKYLKLRKIYVKFIFSEKLVRYFDGAICISRNIEKFFKKYNDNIIKVPILSNIEEKPEAALNFYNHNMPFKIGFFGSIDYEKENFEILFKAINKIKNSNSKHKIRIDLYGRITNITKKTLPQKIDVFDLNEEVFYLGELDQSIVINKMKDYHLLILPRGRTLQNMYGFSTKLSEYLISGVPSLVTNVSDNAIYIKDGINGFIVEPDNVAQLSKKLLFILKNYNNLSKNIVINALSTVSEHFDYKLYNNTLTEFLCYKK